MINLTFEQMHQNTASLNYEGKSNDGREIIIDAAEIETGKFEIMVMTPSGHEIETRFAYSVEDAKEDFDQLMQKHVISKPEPKPVELKGRYVKLRDDLEKAIAVGRSAEDLNPEDGGTCNFDAPAINLPRWKIEAVEEAAKAAGSGCFRWRPGCYVFRINSGAQGNARSRNAEAVCNELRKMGYDAHMYYEMD